MTPSTAAFLTWNTTSSRCITSPAKAAPSRPRPAPSPPSLVRKPLRAPLVTPPPSPPVCHSCAPAKVLPGSLASLSKQRSHLFGATAALSSDGFICCFFCFPPQQNNNNNTHSGFQKQSCRFRVLGLRFQVSSDFIHVMCLSGVLPFHFFPALNFERWLQRKKE